MDDGLERLTRMVAEYRRIGCSVVEIVDLLVDKYPRLRVEPFNLSRVLRSSLEISVHDLHYIVAWSQGKLSRELLEAHLKENS